MKFARYAGNMKLGIFLVTGLLITNAAGGSDGFRGIQCGSDIAKALTGKRCPTKELPILRKDTRI
jgi:hypothetical protein